MSQSKTDQARSTNSIQSKILAALDSFVNDENSAVAVDIRLPVLALTANINGTKSFSAASILKLPIAMALEKKSKIGELDLIQRHSLTEITSASKTKSVLRGLIHTQEISTNELVRIMLLASDELATRYLREMIATDEVNSFLSSFGFSHTFLSPLVDKVSVTGVTNSLEALELVSMASNKQMFPICASALESSIINSRIPLGAQEFNVAMTHKSGSLPGIAHDVAELRTNNGLIRIAFLTKHQPDTVLTSYKMGICTRQILTACGVSVNSTQGFA